MLLTPRFPFLFTQGISSRSALAKGRFTIVSVLLSTSAAYCQNFGPTDVITTSADAARQGCVADLDDDGDLDVLSASQFDHKIAWNENLGAGVFGPQQIITTNALGAVFVFAADLDGDEKIDVLSVSHLDNKIAWYRNLGGGNFGSQQVIFISADGPNSLFAIDLDGDGDADVLSAYPNGGTVVWFENRLNQSQQDFGPEQVVTNSVFIPMSVYAADMDKDGDADVLSASQGDDMVAWYENLGGGSFGPQQVITTSTDAAIDVTVADLDGDQWLDVLSASRNDDKIAWYPYVGPGNGVNGGSYGAQQVITAVTDGAFSVHAADLDKDGDNDVLSASAADHTIAWYENQGGGSFGAQQVIATDAIHAQVVFTGDMDGDQEIDVLSASFSDDKLAWYRNLTISDCNNNLISDAIEIAGNPSLDWNGDGVLDACSSPNYCTSNPNSTGQAAVISVSGTPVISNYPLYNLTLTASQLPTGQPGYFLMANSRGWIPNVAGSAGNLCLGSPLYRFSGPFTGQVLNSGPLGAFSFSPDPGNLPQGALWPIGSTWNFQAWYRDSSANNTNFTDAIEVMFR